MYEIFNKSVNGCLNKISPSDKLSVSDENFSDCLDAISAYGCKEIEFQSQMQAMLAGKIKADQYVKFLFNLYPIVLNFCPIMAVASGNSLDDKKNQLKNYFFDHLLEERGHEHLILNDIKSFGTKIDADALDNFSIPPIQAMLAFNHRLAMTNPFAVLGMIYVLEMMAYVYGGRVACAVSESLSRSLADGFTFLSSHASLDEDHFLSIKKYIVSTENKKDRQSILNAVQVNLYLFSKIISFEE